MPNKMPSPVPKRPDARIQRTQVALSRALVTLMLDREFDAITVQDVLDRAGVGRSTFYSHYRGKEDLLLSDAERFVRLLDDHFEAASADTQRVAPVAELAAHVGAYAAFAAALRRSGQQVAVWELITGELGRIVARRMARLAPAAWPSGLPAEIGSRVIASTAIALIQWWLDRDRVMTPSELDARFHAMVWRGVPSGLRPVTPRG